MTQANIAPNWLALQSHKLVDVPDLLLLHHAIAKQKESDWFTLERGEVTKLLDVSKIRAKARLRRLVRDGVLIRKDRETYPRVVYRLGDPQMMVKEDLDHIWDFDDVAGRAERALSERYVQLRRVFLESYASDEVFDHKLHANYLNKLNLARDLAKAHTPSTSDDIDSWLNIYLPLQQVKVFEQQDSNTSSYTSNNDKNSDSGTLFEKVFQESFPDHPYDYNATFAGGEDEVMQQLRRIFRGLPQTQVDENVSIGLVYYAEELAKIPGGIGPHLPPKQVARRVANKIYDEYKYNNRIKRKQVDMDFVQDEDLYPSDEVIAQDLDLLERIANFKKTELKVLDAAKQWAQTAGDDEPMPKSLKQRLGRLNLGRPPEQVTRYSNTIRDDRPHDLREDYPEQFPVTVTSQAPRLRLAVNHPSQVGGRA